MANKALALCDLVVVFEQDIWQGAWNICSLPNLLIERYGDNRLIIADHTALSHPAVKLFADDLFHRAPILLKMWMMENS